MADRIDVHIATDIVRQCSLCSDPADRGRYRIAVLLEAASRGGSATIHGAFHPGRRVRITPPRNSFALDAHAAKHVLVAGGIVIPISCEQGVCGTCVTRVREGIVDHRDLFLTERQKAGSEQLTACCSRAAAGSVLVLEVQGRRLPGSGCA